MSLVDSMLRHVPSSVGSWRMSLLRHLPNDIGNVLGRSLAKPGVLGRTVVGRTLVLGLTPVLGRTICSKSSRRSVKQYGLAVFSARDLRHSWRQPQCTTQSQLSTGRLMILRRRSSSNKNVSRRCVRRAGFPEARQQDSPKVSVRQASKASASNSRRSTAETVNLTRAIEYLREKHSIAGNRQAKIPIADLDDVLLSGCAAVPLRENQVRMLHMQEEFDAAIQKEFASLEAESIFEVLRLSKGNATGKGVNNTRDASNGGPEVSSTEDVCSMETDGKCDIHSHRAEESCIKYLRNKGYNIVPSKLILTLKRGGKAKARFLVVGNRDKRFESVTEIGDTFFEANDGTVDSTAESEDESAASETSKAVESSDTALTSTRAIARTSKSLGAPTSSPLSQRLFFLTCVKNGWIPQVVDIKCAFLQSDPFSSETESKRDSETSLDKTSVDGVRDISIADLTSEEIYLYVKPRHVQYCIRRSVDSGGVRPVDASQVIGHADDDHSRFLYLLRLKKPLYGLKDGPKFFYDSLAKHLTSLGFEVCEYDSAVFRLHKDFLKEENRFCYRAQIVTHMDDLLHGGNEAFYRDIWPLVLKRFKPGNSDRADTPLESNVDNPQTELQIEPPTNLGMIYCSLRIAIEKGQLLLDRCDYVRNLPIKVSPGMFMSDKETAVLIGKLRFLCSVRPDTLFLQNQLDFVNTDRQLLAKNLVPKVNEIIDILRRRGLRLAYCYGRPSLNCQESVAPEKDSTKEGRVVLDIFFGHNINISEISSKYEGDISQVTFSHRAYVIFAWNKNHTGVVDASGDISPYHYVDCDATTRNYTQVFADENEEGRRQDSYLVLKLRNISKALSKYEAISLLGSREGAEWTFADVRLILDPSEERLAGIIRFLLRIAYNFKRQNDVYGKSEDGKSAEGAQNRGWSQRDSSFLQSPQMEKLIVEQLELSSNESQECCKIMMSMLGVTGHVSLEFVVGHGAAEAFVSVERMDSLEENPASALISHKAAVDDKNALVRCLTTNQFPRNATHAIPL